MSALRTLTAAVSSLAPSFSSANPILHSISRNQLCKSHCRHAIKNSSRIRWNIQQTRNYATSSGKILNETELENIAKTISTGSGYVVIPNVFSQEETETAYNIIREEMKTNKHEVRTTFSDIRHNHYSGMLFGLLSYGEVFQKFAASQVILQISNRILGSNCRLSSYSSNTIYKEMGGQNPHLDYPYYRPLWPQEDGVNFALPHIMSLTFIVGLSDLTPENGSTAVVPGSQLRIDYPDDQEEFDKNCIQISAKSGDLCVIAGSIQHCSMPNKTDTPRCALLQQMISLYINPFEDFRDFEKYVPNNDQTWRQLLALDHPLPKNQFRKSTSHQF